MAEQERKQTQRPSEQEVEELEPTATEQADTDEIDELLDEIDTVLEENAEEFVKNYVQKGGE